MLSIISLGLGTEKDITLKGLELIKKFGLELDSAFFFNFYKKTKTNFGYEISTENLVK